jgi:hypothetical protein
VKGCWCGDVPDPDPEGFISAGGEQVNDMSQPMASPRWLHRVWIVAVLDIHPSAQSS